MLEDGTTLEVKDTHETAGQKPAEPDSLEKKLRRRLQLAQDDLVVFGEDGQFHLIQKATYTAHELPEALMSTAEFLVGLGTVVADVTAFEHSSEWKDLTARCACIVLNLAAIRQISEKKERPIHFLHDGKRPGAERRFAHHTHKHHTSQQARRAAPLEASRSDPDQKLGPDDLVIFNEDKKFYWVKKEDYMSGANDLPDEIRSAPELMVMLGVVVADIPRIPTAGTACFLLNLDSVRNGSHHAAQLLTQNIEGARQEAGTLSMGPSRQPSADEGLQKMVDQQLRILEDKRASLLALKTSPETETVPPSGAVKAGQGFQDPNGRKQ